MIGINSPSSITVILSLISCRTFLLSDEYLGHDAKPDSDFRIRHPVGEHEHRSYHQDPYH